MIEYNKVLEFCVQHKLEMEELMLLYTIETRNKNTEPELHPLMSQYYTQKGGNYDMVESLAQRGFLTILDRSGSRRFNLRNLMVTEKFSDLLFVQPDYVWSEFYKRYPAVGVFGDKQAYFKANRLAPDDKEFFIKNILKNSTKEGAQQILKWVEEMFSYNPSTGKPEGYAEVGISKFLLNWDEILKEHVEKYVEVRSYNRLLN